MNRSTSSYESGEGQKNSNPGEGAVENRVVVSQVRERYPAPPEIDPALGERVEQQVGVREHRPKTGGEQGLGDCHVLADGHVQEVDRGDREGDPPERSREDGMRPERPDGDAAPREVPKD